MNILYFASVDFYAKPNPSFHLMASMITDLLDAGIGVNFVGCSLSGIENHIPEEIASRDGFKYRLIDIPNTPKSSFVKRYLDGITYARKARKHLKAFVSQSDIVFAQSSPTALFNISEIRRLVSKQKIIYNVQDMFPGSSIASGVMPQKWMQRVFYGLQKIAYNKSDIIVAISDDMKTRLIEQDVPDEKIKVIVNWFDDTTVHEVPWEQNRFVAKYNLSPDVFYVQYAGTMGYVFDYKMVLDVAEMLKTEKDIVIQMIGEGSQKQAFIEEANNRNLDNIVFLPLEKQEMVSDVYSACSVCLIPLKEGIIGNSVPSKAGLLMACKRPIVTTADADSSYNEMVNANGIGYAFSTKEPDKVAEAIKHLRDHLEICRNMGVNGYEYGHKSYSRSENMKKYIQLFGEIAH
jgi:colanic acid biosynthesis glycosyl transferase WcaI